MKLKKFVKADELGDKVQTKENSKELTLPVLFRDTNDLPRILATYPFTTYENPGNITYPKEYTECKWQPICMKDIKDIKQAVVSYGMNLPYVRQFIKTRA